MLFAKDADFTATVDNCVLTFIAGYLHKKCIGKHTCENTIEGSQSDTTIMIDKKKYNENINFVYPTSEFTTYVEKMGTLYDATFEGIAHVNGVGQQLYNLLEKIDYNFCCSKFPKEFLIKLFLKVRIFHTLKIKNINLKKLRSRKLTHLE